VPDTSFRINPTRLDDQFAGPQSKAVNRLVDDPEFAPAALASEEDAVRNYARSTQPAAVGRNSAVAPAGGFDVRLRPWGSAAIAAWVGTLIGVAFARQYHRRK
jgi:ElaB/YqjD/DUF883 family membrane-anchored ribosome-binding protein